jgi:putative hydrolase of the HAD superfamily
MPVFFDVDDTLIDHRGAAEAGARALYRRHADRLALALTEDEFLTRWHQAAERHFAAFAAGQCSYQEQRRRRIRDLFGAWLSNEEADALFAVFLAEYERGWALFPDALPCLDALQGETLGVISNNSTTATLGKLRATGIADRFAVIMTVDVAGVGKPDPVIFLAACAAVHATPSQCLYVGDKYDTDALAAQRAGLIGVWLNRRGETMDEAETLPQIASLRELPALVRSVGR